MLFLVSELDVLVEVATAPPRPVNTTPAVPLEAPAGRVVEDIAEDVVVTFTLVGFCAPQGLSSLHAPWQVESPLHAATH